MRPPETRTFKAWANCQGWKYDECTLFLGIYNWVIRSEIPRCMAGCTTALFKTRAEARLAKKQMYYPTRTVRVQVTIEAIE